MSFSGFSPVNAVIESEDLSLYVDSMLAEALGSEAPCIEIIGTDSIFSVALLLSRPQKDLNSSRPQLVVLPTEKDCEKFEQQLRFFNPSVESFLLRGFDVSPYSNLYPRTQNISSRVSWAHFAQQARPGQIFIAPIMALLQKTIPTEILSQNSHVYGPQMELPTNISHFLTGLGYVSVPIVEDVGSFALRGGIVDVFSPAHSHPVRIELFGDTIESLRFFDPITQRSLLPAEEFYVIPAREILYTDDNKSLATLNFNKSNLGREVPPEESYNIIRSINQGHYFQGIDFLLPFFYKASSTPVEHFSSPINIFYLDPLELTHEYDKSFSELKDEFDEGTSSCLYPDYKDLFLKYEDIRAPLESKKILLSKVLVNDVSSEQNNIIQWPQSAAKEVLSVLKAKRDDHKDFNKELFSRLTRWRENDGSVFISCPGSIQAQRIEHALDVIGFKCSYVLSDQYLWQQYIEEQRRDSKLIHIISRPSFKTLHLINENIIFLKDDDILGHKRGRRSYKETGTLQQRTRALSFGELKIDDFVVHKLHGIGIYKGLKVMAIGGVDSEFIELEYRGGDKLYMPVYRVGQIQKYSGPSSTQLIDRLGGSSWAKTQTKVRHHLRDVAGELLRLYAIRAEIKKPAFSPPDEDYYSFENSFPYDETDDQLRAISDVLSDMTSTKPMDRLVCGDVGFGKTEVALRATFKAIEDKRQVAIIAPTTILTFQHLQTFIKRFKGWPVKIGALNRFVPKSKQKILIEELKAGELDIIIGTHRLFSKDISFKNLGLLVIDEEQKFGVKHKEKIRNLKQSVDTLALSATPIPRTLNLSLMGIRDLSIINTAPVDRLPTRTFVTKFNLETIKKAVHSELSRGGQIFFLHNRVHSIYALHDELKEFLPNVRMAVAHGQMDENDLEKTMIKFFNHEIDLLICTTIIESGLDIPRANTMFINNAHQLGLSQLYQLRGRVGRSKTRAYCYLLVPRAKKLTDIAQERLKVIQEHTALGSGIHIAQYDLELRGAGDILGEDQSGNINAVGYELYLDLLQEQIALLKGEVIKEDLEPEINLNIKALIPDNYISDIRIRLSYYKALCDIEQAEDIDKIEEELQDQFGSPPEPVLNLMGIMLIRKFCKDLCVRDITAGKVGLSLVFTESTPLTVDKFLKLTQRHDRKYSLAPDNRLIIRMKEVRWPRVSEELQFLSSL